MTFSRREILAQTALLAQPAARRLNFVFVYTDDQRWDAVRAFGRQSWLQTPNMDRLVREGASFRNSFVTTSLCSPSRSSYLTGQYAHKTGVIDNERTSLLRDGIPTVAALLRQAGYATGYAGKIHIPNFWERDHGFDYFASFPGQGLYFNNPFLVNGKKVPTEAISPTTSTAMRSSSSSSAMPASHSRSSSDIRPSTAHGSPVLITHTGLTTNGFPFPRLGTTTTKAGRHT